MQHAVDPLHAVLARHLQDACARPQNTIDMQHYHVSSSQRCAPMPHVWTICIHQPAHPGMEYATQIQRLQYGQTCKDLGKHGSKLLRLLE